MSLTPDMLRALQQRSVVIHDPASVYIAADVVPDRIAPGVVIHSGCRITGAETSIGPGCQLGEEAPVTIAQCQLDRNVVVKGGYVANSVLLANVTLGSAAHIRPGCLLEEAATAGHAVGLKQTILMPGVTLGSLINFCDCLMAGGSGRKNHSEVGSSFVHFNFTPHGDKATASLLGDVPRGVMLDRPPIFLGGQGGIVGPVSIDFGVTVAAGVIVRTDVRGGAKLVTGNPSRADSATPYTPGLYGDIDRIVRANLAYIGNVRALLAWYRDVRQRFMTANPYSSACHRGAQAILESILIERVRRLGELASNMRHSLDLAGSMPGFDLRSPRFAAQADLLHRGPLLTGALAQDLLHSRNEPARARFLTAIDATPAETDYPDSIRSLDQSARDSGTAWLQSIVDGTLKLW